MEEYYKSLEEVISCISNSKEYKKCIELKEQMSNNSNITDLVKKIKDTQKKYIKSNYDSKIKNELDSLNKQLEEIPIYSIYSQNLEVVNEKIEYVKGYLNDYFNKLLNDK